MKMLKRKLIGVPVWAVALMLIVGTVAGAGIWILTVNVPVEADEPVDIYFSDELMIQADDQDDQWYGPVRLRDTTTTGAVDMTYGTYNVYVRADNPSEDDGGRDIELTTEIQAYDDADEETNDIGFVLIEEEIVDPQDVTWQWDTGERTHAEYNDDTIEIDWGSIDFSETVDAGEEPEHTVIYVGAEDVDVNDYNIEWTLTETDI